jgi:outer membrane protein assembly factor BamD
LRNASDIMIKENFRKIYLFAGFIVAALILGACGTVENKENQTAETVFSKAMQEFKDEDYFEAQKLFDMMRLQYPASDYADDAQFYLAETNFKRKEYILAAFNYGQLRRVHPHSPFYQRCLYQTAQCYVQMSPNYEREQDYTLKAIRTLTEYQTLYPSDTSYAEASKLIETMRDKLAHREYAIALLYLKLHSYHSSVIYYDSVIDSYPDSKYFELSYFGKIDAYFTMKKYEEALGVIDFYKKLFPKGKFLNEIKDIETEIAAAQKEQ